MLLIVALAYALRRSWALAVFVGLALLFIMNQGYWNETMETLSLVLFSALVSAADRRAARHRRGAPAGLTRRCGRCST